MVAQRFSRQFLCAVAVGACVLGIIDQAMGQAPRQGEPIVRPFRRPPLSPYLNMGISQSGPLPSYQAFVVPRLEQQQQQFVQRQLQTRTQALEQAAPVIADPSLRQTGLGSRFQNFSHFYSKSLPSR